MHSTKKISLIFLAIALFTLIPHGANAKKGPNPDSIGDVIKHVKSQYQADDSPESRRKIAEWLTKTVDDRLINSNSSEWFSRPVYAWLGVYWVRNDPSFGDDYYNQANVAWSKGYGNCGENSIVVYYILKKAGVKEHVRYMQAGEHRSHSFTVWGLPPDALTQDPDTWGDAIVVDPWVGEVLDPPEIKDHEWFQDGDPNTPLRDSSVKVDEEAEDWNTIWRNEMVRTGQTGKNRQGNALDEQIDSFFDCFIATAAYGKPENDEINELRDYRDNVLQNKLLGRVFIATYEKLGPIAAFYISQEESRKEWTINNIVKPALEFIKE